ncbi:DUF4279 domain-containing protein [Actinopolymorpha sp. B9G3]|uniref:DUF4279 domain-containing protein n=1 Tax=Actinopolymorpha sp. B9G3 TaxID=3158970 RepID=UPI0032D8DB4A
MAELARALAALRVAGEELVPDAITTALGCEPSRSWAKGEAWISHGVTRTRRFGLWSLDAEETTPADVDAQVATIRGRLTSDEAVWRDLGARYTVDLFCGWFMERGNEGVTLEPETMLALGRRGIPLDVDLYGGDESADG